MYQSGWQYLVPARSTFSSESLNSVREIPKSTRMAWPLQSSTTFSGFKSLQIISFLCNYLSARYNQAAQALTHFSGITPKFLERSCASEPPGKQCMPRRTDWSVCRENLSLAMKEKQMDLSMLIQLQIKLGFSFLLIILTANNYWLQVATLQRYTFPNAPSFISFKNFRSFNFNLFAGLNDARRSAADCPLQSLREVSAPFWINS